MNRPKIENTLTSRMYREALERYVDELEKVDEMLTKLLANVNKSFCDDILRLEKALDKACYELMRFAECDRCPMKDDHCMITNWQCKDKWKEWLLIDD